MTDSYVKCTKCGRTKVVSFGNCLRLGWPTCCGYTMTLVKTEANIDATIANIVREAESQLVENKAITEVKE